MVTISINFLFSICCEKQGGGKWLGINCPDRPDTMSPNQRIHILYVTFTDSTYCLMYSFSEQDRDILKRIGSVV